LAYKRKSERNQRRGYVFHTNTANVNRFMESVPSEQYDEIISFTEALDVHNYVTKNFPASIQPKHIIDWWTVTHKTRMLKKDKLRK